MSVHFRFDWVDGGPSPDLLAQYTMAALSVDAGGAVITGALDRQSGTYSRNVVVPLFSIAEWLVTNWWHLWYEVGDVSEPYPAFEARHNLAFAGDGFVLPRLRMVTTTGRIRLEWTRYQPAHARIEFVDAGQHEVEREALESEFRQLIDAVLERLHGRQETRAAAEDLGRAWAAVNDLDDEDWSSAARRRCSASIRSTRRTPSPPLSRRSGNGPTRRCGRTPWRSPAKTHWRASPTG